MRPCRCLGDECAVRVQGHRGASVQPGSTDFLMLPDQLFQLTFRLALLDHAYHTCYSISFQILHSLPPAQQEDIIGPFITLQGVFSKTEVRIIGSNIDRRIAHGLSESLGIRVVWLRKHAWDLYETALLHRAVADQFCEKGDWKNAMIRYSYAGCHLARASPLFLHAAHEPLTFTGAKSNEQPGF